MDGSNISANVTADEIPEGFTSADPNRAAGASGGPGADSQSKAQAAEAQKQAILEQAMTPEALARLRRIKLVKAEKAAKLEGAIAQMAMNGRLPGPINEGKLIEMLERQGAQEGKSQRPGGFLGPSCGVPRIARRAFCAAPNAAIRTARGSKPTDLVLSGPRVYPLC